MEKSLTCGLKLMAICAGAPRSLPWGQPEAAPLWSAPSGAISTASRVGRVTTSAETRVTHSAVFHQGIATVEGFEGVGFSQHLSNPTAHIGSRTPVPPASASRRANEATRPSTESLILTSGAAPRT